MSGPRHHGKRSGPPAGTKPQFRKPAPPVAELLPMIAVVIPAGPTMLSRFVGHFFTLATNLDRRLLPIYHLVPIGALVSMNMREAVANLLLMPHWERMVILETDMLPPSDALVKHALHTADIVGSVYYLHEAPKHLMAMRDHSEEGRATGKLFDHGSGVGWLSKAEQAEIKATPGLHRVDMVGMGCTSIARSVLERWPKDLPVFQSAVRKDRLNDPGTRGEVSHDYWFCIKAREMGFDVFIDSSIRCGHLTLSVTDDAEHDAHQGYLPRFDAPDEWDEEVEDSVGDASFVGV